MSNGDLNWIANYIWGIADDVLRDLYVRGKYRDVILPIDRSPGSEPPWMWEDQHIRPLSWRTPRAAFCPRIGEAAHGCSAFASAR